MKRRLENTPKTRTFLNKCPTVFLIGYWARCGYRPHIFAGKFDSKTGWPFVYDYDDHNGTDDAWYLRRLDLTTTGGCFTYTFDEDIAKKLVVAFQEAETSKPQLWSTPDAAELPHCDLGLK